MIRALVIVAVAGFITSVVCLSAAFAIGGPQALARGAWSWDWEGWDNGRHFGTWRHVGGPNGPQTTREFPWSGDRLEIDAPADVTYVQAPGPAKLTVRGPAAALDQLQVDGGRIAGADGPMGWPRLQVTLTAPAVTRFELHSANRLRITDYKQDQLNVSVTGHADISAQGETKTVSLRLSGAGDADLSQLKTAGADIDISGAGSASVGPTDWARVQISGVGDVNLLTRPPRLETHIAGAGSVRQPGESSATVGDDDDARGPPRPT
jgi:hypothetical protein